MHKLINLGICHSILCVFGQRSRRSQARYDGDSCSEFVGIDEWIIAAFPKIEHGSNILWCKTRTTMGPKAPDPNFWPERIGDAQSFARSSDRAKVAASIVESGYQQGVFDWHREGQSYQHAVAEYLSNTYQ
jgi:hypothetical protein